MKSYENFGQCLQRLLDQEGLSASKLAQMAGFRSRNSVFRILNGETSADVDRRFLKTLRGVMGQSWPAEYWGHLEAALEIKRLGLQQHRCNVAFYQGMCAVEEQLTYDVEYISADEMEARSLDALLREICKAGELSVVACGCCERRLMALLAYCLSDAGAQGRLTMRHYIDIGGESMVTQLMNVLPLLSKPWYNARLVDEVQCPTEMAPLYRVNMICLTVQLPDGEQRSYQLLQCDAERFICHISPAGKNRIVDVLDRYRFQLEMLKPRIASAGGPQAFVEYTQECADLEKDCMILSIKPDIHFNLVPSEVLYPAIMEGFSQSGLVADGGLKELMTSLYQIHCSRLQNMFEKRRPTHIVYSMTAMERFARTGVQSDHFFIQRAYTPEERRVILRCLLQQMQDNPYFNILFLKPELSDIRSEMTFYEGKGVLLMDAYTSYALYDDHSEALITQMAFMQSFQRFFHDALLEHMVLSRQESLACMERLIAIVNSENG